MEVHRISGAIGKYDFQYTSGECVGGGSEINSGLYHKLMKLL